jgi:hypothetical protein
MEGLERHRSSAENIELAKTVESELHLLAKNSEQIDHTWQWQRNTLDQHLSPATSRDPREATLIE